VIIAGAAGLLVGLMLLARFPTSDSFGDARTPLPWTRDSGLRFSLTMNLLLLGLAAWHYARFRLEKLIVIGLLAVGAPIHLTDPGAGPQAWEQGYEGDELVGMWLFAASAAVVLVGVVWSSARERPTGTKTLWSYVFGAGPGGTDVEPVRPGIVVDAGQRPPDGGWLAADDDWYPPEQAPGYVAPSGSEPPPSPWWQQRWALVFGVLAVLVVIGLVFFRDTATEFADPATGFGDDATEADERGEMQQEEWTITLDDHGEGVHTVVMIKTFEPLVENDIEDVGGRLVWEETEIELCRIGIRGIGDGAVQVGDIIVTTEECEGGNDMQQAFDDFGLPTTACVFVRVEGVDDEHCAPLTAG
jgi:hypothetical protein